MSTGTTVKPVDFEAELAAIFADVKKDFGNPPYTGFQVLQILVAGVGQAEALAAQYGNAPKQWAALEAAVNTHIPSLVAEWLPNLWDSVARHLLTTHLVRAVLNHLESKKSKTSPTTTTTPGQDPAVKVALAPKV